MSVIAKMPQRRKAMVLVDRVYLAYVLSRLLQFDSPDVTIFVDRLTEFIGSAFFEIHRFFTDSAGW